MTAVDILKQAQGSRLVDEDDSESTLELLPPLTDAEIAALENEIGAHLPGEVREVVRLCRGFNGPFDPHFSEYCSSFGSEEMPNALPIAHDGAGNFWVIDLVPNNPDDVTVFFACHDPPVIAYQCNSLEHFVREDLRAGNAPWKSELTEVASDVVMNIWSNNPKMLSRQECLDSADNDLRAFAESLDDSYLFCDLRKPVLGDGFSWGRYGAGTVVKRYGSNRLFAYQTRKLNWFQKIFGV